MMNKLQMKGNLAIDRITRISKTIDLYMTDSIAKSLAEFGRVFNIGVGMYRLYVDGRYDFEEVVSFVEAIQNGDVTIEPPAETEAEEESEWRPLSPKE